MKIIMYIKKTFKHFSKPALKISLNMLCYLAFFDQARNSS